MEAEETTQELVDKIDGDFDTRIETYRAQKERMQEPLTVSIELSYEQWDRILSALLAHSNRFIEYAESEEKEEQSEDRKEKKEKYMTQSASYRRISKSISGLWIEVFDMMKLSSDGVIARAYEQKFPEDAANDLR